MTAVSAGRAYWVRMRDSVPAGGVESRYGGRPEEVPPPMKAGWNFVGFALDQPVSADQVFRGHAAHVASIMRHTLTPAGLNAWEPGSAWPTLEPGRGVWVRLKQDVTLRPRLELVLAPDTSVRPPDAVDSKQATPKDLDLNRNGTIDDAFTQDTVFLDGLASSGGFLVRNAGDGAMAYRIIPDGSWKSAGLPDCSYPPVVADGKGSLTSGNWVAFDPQKVPWISVNSGEGVSPSSNVATGETRRDRPVTLSPLRSGLGPDFYLGRFRVRSTGADRTLYAVLEVPRLSGDYEREAIISAVNGHPRDVGRIGLRVCVDEASAGPLRGVLDAEGSLVFPTDVPLVGGFIDPVHRRFVLSGSITFPGRTTVAPQAGEPPSHNPFPVRLIRDVCFLGTETQPGAIRGEYREVIRGPLSSPVVQSGTSDPKRRTGDPLKPTKKVDSFGTLAGHVIGDFGAEKRSPLAEATVVLTGAHLQKVTKTDGQGAYRFESLTPGVYHVAALAPGYDPPADATARGQRLVEIKGGEDVHDADDLGGDPRVLTLRRRYTEPGKDHILAVIDDPMAPATVRLINIAEPKYSSVLWFVKSDTSSELTQGESRTLNLTRPGLLPVELWLQQPDGADDGKYRKVRETLVIGPLGQRGPKDKAWELVAAESINRQMREVRVGPLVGAVPMTDETAPRAGDARHMLRGSSAGAAMSGVAEGTVRGRGIRLEVGPVSAFGPEVNP
ncbi:MAG: hypothetical protein JWN86_3376 [Planctomycetota bacterium]|nr:hypothetical protein [Planctomycetota bacterium]